MVACSRQLMVTHSGDLFIRSLRVLFLMAGGHGTQYQDLSSWQNAPYPPRHVSPGTVQL